MQITNDKQLTVLHKKYQFFFFCMYYKILITHFSVYFVVYCQSRYFNAHYWEHRNMYFLKILKKYREIKTKNIK